MINNAITADKRVHELSDDTSRLAFTWLVTFADCEGRTHGDPAMVRSMVFPRRADVSVEQVETYIREWAAAGLIKWYEAAGDMWIQFPAFAKNQPGLRKDREPDSCIPAPPPNPANIRQVSGEHPAECPEKRTEQNLNRTEENLGADAPTPTNFPEWQAVIETSTNPNATLRFMHERLFPGRKPPDYAYIGRVAQNVGGAGRLADLMWQAAPRAPTGDVLRYCQGIAKGGNSRASPTPDPHKVRELLHGMIDEEDDGGQ